MKKTAIISAIALAMAASASARDLKADVDLGHNLWWEAPETPVITFTVADTLGRANQSQVALRITPDVDERQAIVSVSQTVSIPAGQAQTITVAPQLPGPGFYKCSIIDDGNVIKRFNIGYEPTLTVSLPDAPADFDEFWAKALAELQATPINCVITEDKAASGKLRKAYDVSMQSLGGETIRGRLYMPVKKGKYPAQIYYNGYGGKPWPFDVDGRPDWIEFVTGVRGQMFNEPYNTYGDWIRYNLENPEEYYYRGAFMDAVRCIDFIEQLDNVAPGQIFAEGGSQGGALTLAAAALGGGRLKAICPYIPFLSDYRDYFRIVPWPGNAVMEAARQKGMSEEQVYDNLRYFDIKNLARRIECPVLMGIGLQDPVCPPHTNMASYALIKAPKQLVIYPTLGHTVDYSDWNPRRDQFFSSFINK